MLKISGFTVYGAGVLGVSPNKSAFCQTKGVSCASYL